MRPTQIKARKRYNKTPFELVEGRTYRFAASGTWTDLYIHSTATGFSKSSMRWAERLRRQPDAKWFSVIGCIDQHPDTQFDIGALIEAEAPFVAAQTGRLYCFANDVKGFYWNNRGAVELSIEPL